MYLKNLTPFVGLATVLLSGFIFLIPSFAQDPELNARDMFYSAADLLGKQPVTKTKPTSSVSQPTKLPKPTKATKPSSTGGGTTVNVTSNALGLRYAVLKRTSGGEYTEVAPNVVFRGGDKIRLSVMSNEKGYLYIVQQGSSGTWSPLFPNSEINSGANAVEPGKNYQIPNGPGEGFVMDEHAGEERVFILLTREPEPDLDKLVMRLRNSSGKGQESAAIENNVIDKLRETVQSRDLVFTKVDDSAEKEKAVYVVNKASSPDADKHVVVDVKLDHK